MKSHDMFFQNMKYSIDFSKIYLETSKVRPSIRLLAVTLNIFHPSPNTPKFLVNSKACKNFFFKSMLSNLYGEHSAWRIKGPADTQAQLMTSIINSPFRWKWRNISQNLSMIWGFASLVPKGLEIRKTPCIPVTDNKFLENWTNILKDAELTLMRELIEKNKCIYSELHSEFLFKLKKL